MQIDLSRVRQRLKSLQNTTSKQKNLWKPEPGKTVIRIVPYKFSKDNWPFIELYFHYNIGTSGQKKSYLSPISFGRKDPIVEFSEQLKESGDKEDWKLGKKLEPKMRTFCPIIVRGHEQDGVKFWGFGKEVYQELLGLINDDDWGDITDPMSGNDIVVTFQTAEEAGRQFAKTTIKPRPNKTPITEDEKIIKLIADSQIEVTEIYKEPTYEELQTVLENWLSPKESIENTVDDDENDTSDSIESISELNNTVSCDDDDDDDDVPFPPASRTSLPTSKDTRAKNEKPKVVKQSVVNPSSKKVDDVSKAFDELFKK